LSVRNGRVAYAQCFTRQSHRSLSNRARAQASDFAREPEFLEVVELIRSARQRALQAVNANLVALYWEVGRYISQKLQKSL
jgi:DUF1016 N-terminal domain